MRTATPAPATIECGAFVWPRSRPLIMGIVNVTPDSFSDGGQFVDPQRALTHALQLHEAGADLIDIGGESTRPGAATVSEAVELVRVIPLLKQLAGRGIAVSVDTQKTAVMQVAIAEGAAMINDVNALQAAGALELCAKNNVGVCLMHRQGSAKTMQIAPTYTDVVGEVKDFLLTRAGDCEQAGISRSRIVIDPGFGFGKTPEHNRALLRHLPEFANSGYAVLVGLSRKSFLGYLTGREVVDRLAASLATALIATQKGAAIVRVHDVPETVDVLKVLQAIS